MLDEVISDIDTGPMPLNALASEIKVQPADAIFGPFRLEETGNVIPGADTPSPPNAAAPEIKIQPADGMLGHVPIKDTERASTRQGAPFFTRLLRYSARTAAVAGFCGLAWAGGVYYSLGYSPFDVVKASRAPEGQQSPQHDDIVRAVRQMAEDVRALKTKVDGKDVAQDAVPKNQLNSGQTTTGPTIADLTGRVDKLDAEVTAKLSKINEQLASIQQQIPASHATVVARAQPPQKRVKHPHDAFDPSKDSNAPGVPRPLGSR